MSVRDFFLIFVLLHASVCGYAQDSEADQAQLLEDLRELAVRQAVAIERLEARVADLEARLAEVAPESAARPEAMPEPQPTPAQQAEALPELSEEERREQERLVRAAFQRALIDRGGLLLPPKTIDVQPSLAFTHSSSENIVIDGFTVLPVLVVGDIVSEKVERELTQFATTLRIGLPWRSQLDVRLPYTYHRQRSFAADGDEVTTSSAGTGDIEIGFSRELGSGQGRRPDFIASVRWKTTTGSGPFDLQDDTELALGSGYDSLNVGITGVKVVDPVVYFGTVSFGKNFSRSEAIGRYDPGDSVGISLGMAIALNLNSSLSFSYDHQRIRRTRVDGLGVPGSYLTTGVLTVGSTFAISDRLAADLSLNIGLTEDSPDIQIGASFPIRMRW